MALKYGREEGDSSMKEDRGRYRVIVYGNL